MTTFRDYPVRLVDVSQYQDNPDTAYKPELDMLQALGIQGFIMRVGYGLVEDRAFKWFWNESRGKFKRKTYWYGDYYSNRYTSTTDAEWGEIQAETCWNLVKSDPSFMPIALDCEASTYGGLISSHRASFNTIMKSYCETYDVLSGKYTEIYTSPSLLSSFDDWAKDRTLWIAWYNKLITYQNIVDAVKAAGWRGKVIIWQYASDGDINNDGIPEGLVLGFESKGLDLNVFLGTVEEWDVYSGGEDVTVPVPEKDPNALFLAKCIKPVDTRNELGVDIKMDLAVGDYVNVYEERADGMWRIAPLDIQRWVVSSPNYMEKIVPPPPPPPALPEMFKAICIKQEGVDTRNELGVDIKQDLHFADIVSVYAIDLVNKMYRIDPVIQRWVVTSTDYMLKLAPPEQKPIFSDSEKASLRSIRDAHPELDIK